MQLVGDDDDVVARGRERSRFPSSRRRSTTRSASRRPWCAIQTTAGTVGAGNRDGDVLRGGGVLRIRHRHRIGERERLSLGYEIRQIDRKVGQLPVDGSRACPGTVLRNRCGERRFEYLRAGRAPVDPGPESAALVSLVETVWVSVRSTSVNASVPEVGTFVVRLPPGMLLPPENEMCCGPVVMTGTSLVPVIVIVNERVVVSSFGAKLLSTVAV